MLTKEILSQVAAVVSSEACPGNCHLAGQQQDIEHSVKLLVLLIQTFCLRYFE